MNDTQTAALQWFSGKSLVKAQEAMELLAASEAQGYWVPKASRKVRTALKKHNVAIGLAKKHYGILYLGKGFGMTTGTQYAPENSAVQPAAFKLFMALRHSSVYDNLNIAALALAAKTDEEHQLVAQGAGFIKAMTPVWASMRTLDNTRPKPTFTFLGVSPTVTKTLLDVGLTLNLETLRVCPGEYIKVEEINGNFHYVYVLKFPAGTKHNTSRFSNPGHCQACGHSIKNNYNWVPILADDAQGVPHSMWVGRDCAKSVFGIDMEGELEIDKMALTAV